MLPPSHDYVTLSANWTETCDWRASTLTSLKVICIRDGYARKVMLDEMQQGSRHWYLPHHSVTCPRKPDKLRVVFDAAARYRGTSLNDNLLTGPDLANSLIGVLLRFRQRPVPISADIQAM